MNRSPSLEIKTVFTANVSAIFSWIQKFSFKSILTAVHKGVSSPQLVESLQCGEARDNRAVVWLLFSLKDCSLPVYMDFQEGSPSEALGHCCGTGLCTAQSWGARLELSYRQWHLQVNDTTVSSSHLVRGSLCLTHSFSLTSNLLQSTHHCTHL